MRSRLLRTVLAVTAATGLALALRLVSFAGELVAIAAAQLLALVLARRDRKRPRSSPRCSTSSTTARPTSCSATVPCPPAAPRAGRATTLAELDFDAMLATGYAFQVETTQLAHLMGKRIEQVPFVFSERVAGHSKMPLAISLEGIRVTLALRRHTRAAG